VAGAFFKPHRVRIRPIVSQNRPEFAHAGIASYRKT
jgi:hypothetical protein